MKRTKATAVGPPLPSPVLPPLLAACTQTFGVPPSEKLRLEETAKVKSIIQQLAVDVDSVATPSGNTALMLAAQRGKHHLLVLLVREGKADPNKTNSNRDSALMFASMGGHVQSVEALRSLGAKREIANLHGMTCLMCAACAGGDAVATCKALLSPSSDAPSSSLNLVEATRFVNQQDQNGNTAMHFAAQMGNKNCLLFLLEHGGDITLKDAKGHTPLDIAKTSEEPGAAACAKILGERWQLLQRKADEALKDLLQGQGSGRANGKRKKKKKQKPKKKDNNPKHEEPNAVPVTTLEVAENSSVIHGESNGSIHSSTKEGGEEKERHASAEDDQAVEGEVVVEQDLREAALTIQRAWRNFVNKRAAHISSRRREVEDNNLSEEGGGGWVTVQGSKKKQQQQQQQQQRQQKRPDDNRQQQQLSEVTKLREQLREERRALKRERKVNGELRAENLLLGTENKNIFRENRFLKGEIESLRENIAEHERMEAALKASHPFADDLALRCAYLFGLDTNELSMSQVIALRKIHKQALVSLALVKRELEVKQKVIQEEQEKVLQQQLLYLSAAAAHRMPPCQNNREET